MQNKFSFKVNIYALINPINGHIFYIGSTKQQLKIRLCHHISLVKYSWKPDGKTKLIKKILKKNQKPEILLLECVPFQDASFTEQFYYHLFRSYGFTMLQSAKYFNYNKLMTGRINNKPARLRAKRREEKRRAA